MRTTASVPTHLLTNSTLSTDSLTHSLTLALTLTLTLTLTSARLARRPVERGVAVVVPLVDALGRLRRARPCQQVLHRHVRVRRLQVGVGSGLDEPQPYGKPGPHAGPTPNQACTAGLVSLLTLVTAARSFAPGVTARGRLGASVARVGVRAGFGARVRVRASAAASHRRLSRP